MPALPWHHGWAGVRPAVAWLWLAVAFGLTACTPSMDWREYRSEEGRFSISMPAKPAKSERSLPLQPAAVTMRMLSAQAQGQVFGVGVAAFPAGLPADVLPQFRDALVRGMQGKLVDEKPWRQTGIAFTVRNDKATLRAKLITFAGDANAHIPPRLYQVALVTPHSKSGDGAKDTNKETSNIDAELFFDSFKPY
jgi:hypothetical protein